MAKRTKGRRGKTASDEAPELDDETVAVLAAAISAYLGKTVRIRHAHMIHRTHPSLWSQPARQGIQTAWAALRQPPSRENR